jgi:3-phenylpropionate/cinnamic acid dioxygenase small subunit
VSEMDAMIDSNKELECRDMVIRCIRALDERDYDAVAASFAEDGVWERAGERLTGPLQVRTALDKRPNDLETQHLVSNMVVDEETDKIVTIRYSLSAFAQRGQEVFHLHAIFKAEDRLVGTPAGWRFLSRCVVPAFKVLG